MTWKFDLQLEPDLPPVDYPLPDLPDGEDLWIFGYGSLMWRPGFDHLGIRDARLFGYHRAFCVSSVIDYLYRREMVTSVYRPKMVRIKLLAEDVMAPALTFVADPSHAQYCGKPALEEAARIIARAHGRGGPNVDYLKSTLEHLDEFGIADGPLHRILNLIEREM